MTTTTARRTTRNRSKSAGTLIGYALEIPPAAYIALSGQVPLWARIWLSVWLSLWLLFTVVTAVNAQTKGT